MYEIWLLSVWDMHCMRYDASPLKLPKIWTVLTMRTIYWISDFSGEFGLRKGHFGVCSCTNITFNDVLRITAKKKDTWLKSLPQNVNETFWVIFANTANLHLKSFSYFCICTLWLDIQQTLIENMKQCIKTGMTRYCEIWPSHQKC